MKKINKYTISILLAFIMIFNYILPIVPVNAADSLTKDYSEISSLPADYSYGTLFYGDDTELLPEEDNTSKRTNNDERTDIKGYGFHLYAAKTSQIISLRITNCAVDKDGDICDVLLKVTDIKAFDNPNNNDRLGGNDTVLDNSEDVHRARLQIGKYEFPDKNNSENIITTNLIGIWLDTYCASSHFTMKYVKHGTKNAANISKVTSVLCDFDAYFTNYPNEIWEGCEGFTIDDANGEVYYAKGHYLIDTENEKGVRTPATIEGRIENNNQMHIYSSAVATEQVEDATYKLFYSGGGCGILYIFASPYNFELDNPIKTADKSVVYEGDVFNYKIIQYVPNNYYADELNYIDNTSGKYTSFSISDELDSHLEVKGNIGVKDESGRDVTNYFDITEVNNKVTASVKATYLSNLEFYAHSYILNIPVSVKSGTGLSVAKISNEATTVAVTSTGTETKESVPIDTGLQYKEKVTSTIDNGTVQVIDGTVVKETGKEVTYNKTIAHGGSSTVDVTFKADNIYRIVNVTIDGTQIDLEDCETNDNETYTYKFTDSNINKDIEHSVVVTTELKDASVIAKYVDESGKEIASSQTLNGKITDDYTTTEKTIPNYELIEQPENATGKMTENPITVTYVYRLKDTSVVVKYIDADTEKEIADSETIPGKATEKYTTTEKTIEKYKLVTTPVNASGTMTEEPIEVIYYYTKKDAAVVANYVDEDGKQIADSETKTGKIDDEYTTEAKGIKGYELTKDPENKAGTMVEGTTTVNYVYKAKDAEVIVKYVDEFGNEIADNVIIKGKYYDTYDTSGKTISGYTLTKTPANASGTINSDTVTVTYIYSRLITELPKTGNMNNMLIVAISAVAVLVIVMGIKNKKYKEI